MPETTPSASTTRHDLHDLHATTPCFAARRRNVSRAHAQCLSGAKRLRMQRRIGTLRCPTSSFVAGGLAPRSETRLRRGFCSTSLGFSFAMWVTAYPCLPSPVSIFPHTHTHADLRACNTGACAGESVLAKIAWRSSAPRAAARGSRCPRGRFSCAAATAGSGPLHVPAGRPKLAAPLRGSVRLLGGASPPTPAHLCAPCGGTGADPTWAEEEQTGQLKISIYLCIYHILSLSLSLCEIMIKIITGAEEQELRNVRS